MKPYSLPTAYVILLTFCIPLHALFLFLSFLTAEIGADSILPLCDLLFIFYWTVIIILGIKNIRRSFFLCRQKDVTSCVNSMLILKYGMVVFFAVNFIAVLFFMLCLTLGLLVGSRGTIIFAFPFVIPVYLLLILAAMIFTWFLLVPGGFYGIQVIRLTYSEKKTSLFAALIHGIFQFTFFLDVLDAMYLAVVKYGRGKKASAIIAILYLLLIIGSIWLGVRIYGLFF